MTYEEFRAVCRAACLALNIEEPDALADGDDIFVDGVKLGLFHDEEVDDDVHCYVDIGSIDPAPDTASIFQEVLAINLELDARLGEVIGVERKSGHLVLRAQIPAKSGFDERLLVSRLKGYVELVNELYGGVLSRITSPARFAKEVIRS